MRGGRLVEERKSAMRASTSSMSPSTGGGGRGEGIAGGVGRGWEGGEGRDVMLCCLCFRSAAVEGVELRSEVCSCSSESKLRSSSSSECDDTRRSAGDDTAGPHVAAAPSPSDATAVAGADATRERLCSASIVWHRESACEAVAVIRSGGAGRGRPWRSAVRREDVVESDEAEVGSAGEVVEVRLGGVCAAEVGSVRLLRPGRAVCACCTATCLPAVPLGPHAPAAAAACSTSMVHAVLAL